MSRWSTSRRGARPWTARPSCRMRGGEGDGLRGALLRPSEGPASVVTARCCRGRSGAVGAAPASSVALLPQRRPVLLAADCRRIGSGQCEEGLLLYHAPVATKCHTVHNREYCTNYNVTHTPPLARVHHFLLVEVCRDEHCVTETSGGSNKILRASVKIGALSLLIIAPTHPRWVSQPHPRWVARQPASPSKSAAGTCRALHLRSAGCADPLRVAHSACTTTRVSCVRHAWPPTHYNARAPAQGPRWTRRSATNALFDPDHQPLI